MWRGRGVPPARLAGRVVGLGVDPRLPGSQVCPFHQDLGVWVWWEGVRRALEHQSNVGVGCCLCVVEWQVTPRSVA